MRVYVVACFYLRFIQGETQKGDFYHAAYLGERTVHDSTEEISLKRCIGSKHIARLLHIKQDGLKIMVDDDVVHKLPDDQNIDVEISEVFDSTGDSKTYF